MTIAIEDGVAWAREYGRLRLTQTFPPFDEKHLPGRHPQGRHGRGGGGGYRPAKFGPGNFKDMPSVQDMDIDPFGPNQRGSIPTNGNLELVAEDQGFDGPAELMNKSDFEDVLDKGGREIWRGIEDDPDVGNATALAAEFTEGGPYRGGRGLYADGYYFAYTTTESDGHTKAKKFGEDGHVMRAAVRPEARIVEHKELQGIQDRLAKKVAYTEKGPNSLIFGDTGTFAAAMGFDAIDVKHRGYMIVLNRTAIVVQEGNAL